MKDKLLLLQSMLLEEFNWDDCDYEGSLNELFKECYIWHSYKKQGNRPVATVECGSIGFTNTPKTIYRLLWLLCPDSVDFSRMYKSPTWIELCSPEYHFCAGFQFYKYELGCYFHCAPEHAEGNMYNVQCGAPGSDNGIKCKSELGKLWFSVLEQVLEHEHNIYPGNNFVV